MVSSNHASSNRPLMYIFSLQFASTCILVHVFRLLANKLKYFVVRLTVRDSFHATIVVKCGIFIIIYLLGNGEAKRTINTDLPSLKDG